MPVELGQQLEPETVEVEGDVLDPRDEGGQVLDEEASGEHEGEHDDGAERDGFLEVHDDGADGKADALRHQDGEEDGQEQREEVAGLGLEAAHPVDDQHEADGEDELHG